MSVLDVTGELQKSQVTYANPIVVSVLSATGRAYAMLRQTEWCYSVMCIRTH